MNDKPTRIGVVVKATTSSEVPRVVKSAGATNPRHRQLILDDIKKTLQTKNFVFTVESQGEIFELGDQVKTAMQIHFGCNAALYWPYVDRTAPTGEVILEQMPASGRWRLSPKVIGDWIMSAESLKRGSSPKKKYKKRKCAY